jgi:phosphatidylglycerol:prolipoprotein diacylglycerol transferase
MHPVLIEVGGFQLQSYGVSKALAAIVGGWLLQRELRRRGRNPEPAFTIAIAALVGGFLGAKLYYLAEQSRSGLTAHDFGPSGFTWYGGLIGGAIAVALVAHRHRIELPAMAAMAVVPLAVAYGIGRLGCLLAGDGTCGSPTGLPWGMSFPEGTMPTTAIVHPTPLYEALAAFAIAGLLWTLRDRASDLRLFGAFAILFGAQRFLVEFVRINDPVVAGLTAPQLWSVGLALLGFVLVTHRNRTAGTIRPAPAAASGRA